jgi:hypothetical protein
MEHPDPDARHHTLGRLVYRGAGLTVRAYTADELRRRLQPAEVPIAPAALPEVAPGAPDGLGGRPGGSALGEHRRRRAAELARWTAGLPWRLGLVAAAGLAGATLAGRLELPHTWLLGLLAAALAAWALRFQRSQATRAWRDGARGERATARRLRRLEREGYTVLHDLAVPGNTRANIDHLVIGPSGVFVIDSKRYRGHLHQTADGMLWHGRYPLAQALATLWWEARLIGDTLDAGPQVPITPLLVIHKATVPWGGLIVAGVPVIAPDALTEALGREPVLPGEEVGWLAARAAARLGPAA